MPPGAGELNREDIWLQLSREPVHACLVEICGKASQNFAFALYFYIYMYLYIYIYIYLYSIPWYVSIYMYILTDNVILRVIGFLGV